jgi:hypothetical protein
MAEDRVKPGEGDQRFEPPETHKAADRAGKQLGHMAGAINEALDAHDEPVVLDRRGRHVSIKELEDLIDQALADNDREREKPADG